MPIPDSFTKAGYTKDTKFKVIKADGQFRVGEVVSLDEDNSPDWANNWAFFKSSEGYFHDMYFRGSKPEVEAIVEDKKEEQIMTFDMTKCKIGDKLKTRGADKVILEDIFREECTDFPYKLSNGECVTKKGTYFYSPLGPDEDDIIGFWEEEEEELSEDNESFPNIEVRTPHIAKIITYRVHFNEMFHRDLSEDEAMAIYQQLKELLGEK